MEQSGTMLKAIILDLCGTLTLGSCDPEAEIIEMFDLKCEYGLIESFVCGTKFEDWSTYIEGILRGVGLPITDENIQRVRQIFEEDYKKDKILDGVKDVLGEIKMLNLGFGLISNCPNDNYKILERNNLGDFFDVKIYSHEVGLVKPSKEIFQLALQSLKVKPEEALMIGDSMSSDIKGAEGVGIQTLLADYKNKFPDYKGPRVTSLRSIPEYVKMHFLD